MGSENPSSADNQQERLDAYIAGFVDGEGSFHVAICRNAGTRAGWQLVPEFRVSQNCERREVLDLIARRLVEVKLATDDELVDEVEPLA